MANDIDKNSPHYKGEFGSIYEVNQKFPSGGVAGDYVAIDGWAHYWNADRGTWCVNAKRDSYWDELITNIADHFKTIKGATYMGVAGIDTVPEKENGAKMYYFATQAGTYNGFGGLNVPQGVNVLYSEDGKSWICQSLLEVAQETGDSELKVLSQKAVKAALSQKVDSSTMTTELGKKADKSYVDTELGKKADANTMTTELDKKFDKVGVVQETGDSEELVMSQKAVSDKLSDLNDKKVSKEDVQASLDTKVDKEEGKSLIDSEVADAHSVIDNPEFLGVETDADGKVLAGTYADGSHYAHNMKSETIPEEFSHIEDLEGRMEIETDADDRILSYRDFDGVKHETNMQVNNLAVENLNLQGNSVQNIEDALKANGFSSKSPTDWSDSSFIQIPEPRFAIINITGITEMPITKTQNLHAWMEFWDM